MTEEVFDNNGINKAAVPTLIDTILSGGSEALKQISLQTKTIQIAVTKYISDGQSFIAALYREFEATVPSAALAAIPNAAKLSEIAKNSGLGLALSYAALEVATAKDKAGETIKQSTLLGSGMMLAEGLAAGLIARNAVPVVAVSVGAVLSGLAIAYLDNNWDTLVSEIEKKISSGLSAADAAAQVTSEWTNKIAALFDKTGADALNLLQNPNAISGTANILNLLKAQLERDTFIEGCPVALPTWLAGSSYTGVAPLLTSVKSTTPLVLDLDGDGVELTALKGTGAAPVYWDTNNDGFREAMGWVKPDDGLLVRDLNNNGKIDNQSELFGNAATDGFSMLKALDSNKDGKITSADAAFNSLKVWRDLNSNGITDAGELSTLAQLGITSINLNATAPGTSIAGNAIAWQSTFTRNGQTRTIVDALFATDYANSVDTNPVTLKPEALILPQLRGYGTVSDLAVAMSRDATLLSMVKTFAAKTLPQLLAAGYDLRGAITSIMPRWAGVDGLAANSRGLFVDARQLTFLEKITGVPYASMQAGNGVNPSEPGTANNLKLAFELSYQAVALRLFMQGAGQSLMPGLYYNSVSDKFEGSTAINATALAQVKAAATAAADKKSFWTNFVELLEAATQDGLTLAAADANSLSAAITATSSSLSLASIRSTISAKPGIDDRNAPEGVHNIGGTRYSDSIVVKTGDNTVYGNEGDDTIIGGNGNDVIYGGAGDDILSGGLGADKIYGQDGNDKITVVSNEATGDVIDGGAGYDILACTGDITTVASISNIEELDDFNGSTFYVKAGQIDAIRGGPGNSDRTISGASA